ncbi:MAG: branched-chain amino acid ABC transporter substrate-binding protein [Solirubrobacterales bacterium]|nr:branched-chain amino acid ABC transporter substrate-binding protein [Solirubrobacterales bacterium]
MRIKLVTGLVALGTIAVVIAACGGGSGESDKVAGLDLANCGDVAFGGGGSPDALIVSDLPLQGDSKARSAQMNEAITQVLDDAGWKAGEATIGFQACDDSDAETGLWDEEICRDNATAYSDDSSVIGVVGTYNSGCAQVMIPTLNEADGGGLAMVSPGNTAICLTQTADSCSDGQPGSLYPSGKRNYARVVPNDAAQGAALATFAATNNMKRVAVLNAAGDDTSIGQAATFVNAAGPAGVTVSDQLEWDPEADNYTALMKKVAASDPDAVLLAGLTEQNGGRLIKDKVAVLGPNDGKVALLAPDGFAQQATIDEAGQAAAKGMFASVPGRAPELLPGPGKQFVKQLQAKVGSEPVEIYAPYAGQAARVLLDTIGSAGLDRGKVAAALAGLKVSDGIIGDFTITDTGDPDKGPVTISRAGASFKPLQVVEPSAALVTAARGKSG